MTKDTRPEDLIQSDRRNFLRGVAAVTSAAPLAPHVLLGAVTTAAALVGTTQPSAAQSAPAATAAPPDAELPGPALGYESFGPDEAGFVEAMVNVMCPADKLTPAGVDCGLAVFIDRQLAGGFGKGERLYMRGPWHQGKPQHGYQLPLTPEQFYKVGLAAADMACRQRFQKRFVELDPAAADAFLHDIAGGKVTDPRVPLASWFNELVYPLFAQACFADPMYGGNVGKVFWKMIGYPGLPAVHSQDILDFRGKPYPGAADPKSIADFS